jgi:hypothetical protein
MVKSNQVLSSLAGGCAAFLMDETMLESHIERLDLVEQGT